MELVENRIFSSKREFSKGMEEIKHFMPPCEYEYKFFESYKAFPRPSKRVHYGVEIFRRDEKTIVFCSECQFNNYGECSRPEEE